MYLGMESVPMSSVLKSLNIDENSTPKNVDKRISVSFCIKEDIKAFK
jgi:hypothetical protein